MKIIFLLSFIVFALNVSSQTVFQKISFKEAVTESQKTGKLILVQLESLDCEMCNYFVTKAFEDDKLLKKINETFIAIKVDSKHPDRNLINNLYYLQDKSYGTLFIDGNKNLVNRYEKTTTLASEYDKEFDVALYKNSEVIKLNIFGDLYNKSQNNNDLEEWIWARNNLNLNNDSLLNIYAKSLSADSINSTRVLTFIAKQSPLKGSTAYNILRSSSQFNNVWDAIPIKERRIINNKIISKSMQKAILEKNEDYALSVANFARSVYGKNNTASNLAFGSEAMKFYQGTFNMEKYMMYATLYYDSALLKRSVTEVLMADSLMKVEMMNNASDHKTEFAAGVKRVTKTFSFRPKAQNFTNTLNEAAWFIYTNTDNKSYLQKALEWASKANQYFKKFEAMDTEARILYKLGEKKAAIELMENAVKLKNERIKSATAFNDLDIVLNNMKENKTIIDAE